MDQVHQSIVQMVTTLASKEQIEMVLDKLAAIHLQQLEIMKAHNAGFQSVPVYRIGNAGEGEAQGAGSVHNASDAPIASGSGFGGSVQGLGTAGATIGGYALEVYYIQRQARVSTWVGTV